MLGGRVGVRNAAVCAREMDCLTPRLCPDAVPAVWDALIQLGSEFGPREIRAVRPRLLAEYGADGGASTRAGRGRPPRWAVPAVRRGRRDVRVPVAAGRRGQDRSRGSPGPLAAPRPAEGSAGRAGIGPASRRRLDRDRPPGGRLPRRSSDDGQGAGVSPGSNSDDLVRKTGCAVTVGSADAHTVLAPETLRRMACRRQVSSPSSWADLRTSSTWAGRAAVPSRPPRSRRSGYATAPARFPAVGCPPDAADAPPRPDTGPAVARPTSATRPSCAVPTSPRWVHDHRLTATLTAEGRVLWDLTPGSYDQALRRRH